MSTCLFTLLNYIVAHGRYCYTGWMQISWANCNWITCKILIVRHQFKNSLLVFFWIIAEKLLKKDLPYPSTRKCYSLATMITRFYPHDFSIHGARLSNLPLFFLKVRINLTRVKYISFSTSPPPPTHFFKNWNQGIFMFHTKYNK